MTPRIGYLLPTREQVMEGRPEAAPLLALADRAEALGYASVWVGDSVLARPRHDPLTLLPALRNPVLLAHQVATLDQIAEGRVILGVGIASDVANIRAEFAACGVPVTLVRGARSSFVDDADVAEMARLQPRLQVQMVVDAGHSVQSDQPLELVRLLRDFLAAPPAAG